jgi:hypothetical protein
MPKLSDYEKSPFLTWVSFFGGWIALIVLVSWYLIDWQVHLFGNKSIPMVPSTAFLLLFLSSSLFCRAQKPQGICARKYAYFSILLVESVSLILILQNWLLPQINLDRLLMPANFFHAESLHTRMAFFTKICFMSTGLSFYLTLPSQMMQQRNKQIASLVILGTLLYLLSLLANYALGTINLFDVFHAPMAILTACTFIALNLGLRSLVQWDQGHRRQGPEMPPVQRERDIENLAHRERAERGRGH